MSLRAIAVCLLLPVLIAGCSTASNNAHLSHVPHGKISIKNEANVPAAGPAAERLNRIAPAAGQSAAGTMAYRTNSPPPAHCRLGDRFDDNDVIAYNFSDGQSRVGLHMDVNGPGLTDIGRFEVKTVMINFRYRLQPIKKKQEECLYKSGWQGLVGSGYNEFFVRESHTVYEAIDDEMNRVYEELDVLF